MKTGIIGWMARALFATALAGIVPTAFADPGKTFTITVAGAVGETPLKDFPLLVRLSPQNVSGFSYDACAADGRDVSFKLQDGTVLDREIEKWDSNGESLIWVRVPSLTTGTVIDCFYGDASVTAQPASQTNGAVWRAGDYVGVWHMDEPDNTAVKDATGRGLDAEVGNQANRSSTRDSGAPVGNGRVLSNDVNGNYLKVADYRAHVKDGSVSFTIGGWYKASGDISGNKAMRFFSNRKDWKDSGFEAFYYREDSGDWIRARAGTSDDVFTGENGKGAPIESVEGKWLHVAIVYDGLNVSAYTNGALLATGTAKSQAMHTANGLVIGGYLSTSISASFVGSADEVRLRDGVSSPAWIKAEYDATRSGFVAYGSVASAWDATLLRVSGQNAAGAVCAFGEPTPGYGTHQGARVSSFTAPAPFVEASGERWEVLGYRMYAVSGEGERTLIASKTVSDSDWANGGPFAYEHGDTMRELVWLWKVRHTVSANVADDGGGGRSSARAFMTMARR